MKWLMDGTSGLDSRKQRPTEEEIKSPKPGRNTIKTIRKELGWVAGELEAEGKGKIMTKRRAHRQRALSQRMGKRRRRRNRPGIRRTLLFQVKENLRAQLQIGLLKERKRKQIVAREKAQAEFRKQGPRSLRPKLGENQEDMDIAGIEEIGKFWKEKWKERGQYDLGHPALEHWKVKMNGMGDRTETPQVSRDSRWKAAVKGMACWKAPGPDKIHRFWHKAFPQTNSLLKNCIWEIIDGSDEMPDWVVRGRTVMIPKDGFSGPS